MVIYILRRCFKIKLYENKKQLNQYISWFLVFASVIVFYLFITNFSMVFAKIKWFLSLFSAIYIGFAIAFLLNPLLKFFENKLFKKIKNEKTKRSLGVTLCILSFLVVVLLVLWFIVPGLFKSLTTLVENVPSYLDSFLNYSKNYIANHPSISETYVRYSEIINGYISQIVEFLSSKVGEFIPKLVGITISLGSAITNFFIGIIVAIYMLLTKEKIIERFKKLSIYLFREKATDKLSYIFKVTGDKVSNYFAGKLISCVIVGICTYLFLLIFKMPFPLLCAVIVGICEIIPFFGSLIGAIISGFIILIINPLDSLYFIIFILILQQIDGNIIGPKIQGRQLGLSALWILFAIFLFGGAFGFWGLLLGVPFFASFYQLAAAHINRTLKERNKKDL